MCVCEFFDKGGARSVSSAADLGAQMHVVYDIYPDVKPVYEKECQTEFGSDVKQLEEEEEVSGLCALMLYRSHASLAVEKR